MGQHAFTIVTPIQKSKIDALKSILGPIGKNIKGTTKPENWIDFSKYENLHFCCFVVLDDDGTIPVLIFEGNIDGPIADFLDGMIDNNGSFLQVVYSHCKGLPEDAGKAKLLQYLLDHDEVYNTFFLGHPGLTRQQIKRDQHLRNEIETFLDDSPPVPNSSGAALKTKIQNFINPRKGFKWLESVPEMPFNVRYGQVVFWGIVLVVVLLVLYFLAVLFGFTGAAYRYFAFAIFGLIAIYLVWLRYR